MQRKVRFRVVSDHPKHRKILGDPLPEIRNAAGVSQERLSHGIGSKTQKPLAVAIIGGLISATLLTLIVLLTLYVVSANFGEPMKDDEADTPVLPLNPHTKTPCEIIPA